MVGLNVAPAPLLQAKGAALGGKSFRLIIEYWLFTIEVEILHFVQNGNYLNRSLHSATPRSG